VTVHNRSIGSTSTNPTVGIVVSMGGKKETFRKASGGKAPEKKNFREGGASVIGEEHLDELRGFPGRVYRVKQMPSKPKK